MPVNPYDDSKVSLWRPQGNGDLDIVRASFTHCNANVTEALWRLTCDNFQFKPQWNRRREYFVILSLCVFII